ncbi:MAG TPA: RNA polymerase sigma factor RpoD/SigA [Spirochaetia bacterium]|nr:RNA polymerase sigma factor RpoD/SigA [Spirochaetia bacterium]
MKRIRRTGESVISLYFQEISKIPLLCQADEKSLARRALQGDQFARERLIQANLRFVVNVARSYHARGLPLEDLVSEGNIGLMKAIDTFDPEKGYRFISYAVWWIRQNILKAINEKSRMIRLPLNRSQQLLRIMRVREDLRGEHSPKSEAETISQRPRGGCGSMADLLNISRDLLSLDAPPGDENDFSPLEDRVEDRGSKTTEEILIEKSLRADINAVLTSLSKRESEILQYRYGLNGKTPMSLREIGSRCKLTKERIRQIEKNAIKHLRHPSRSHVLRAYT